MAAFVPSRSLLMAAAVPLALSVLGLLDARFLTLAWAVTALIVVSGAFDALLSSKRYIRLERYAPEVMSLRRRNAVSLVVRSSAPRTLRATIIDDLFDGASSNDLPLTVDVPPGDSVTVTYHVVPTVRGAHALGDEHVRFRSVLGLWHRQLRIAAKTPIRVYPDIKQIQLFDLLARESREYALVRASKLKGGESEFARLRDHVPDDEYRSVDWKSTARRQKLTVREYQLESNQNLVFMLEGGRMMTGIDAGLSRFDHALNAALMLAHVATRGGDRVGVLGFDRAVRVFVAPQGGPGATRHLIQATYDLRPELVEPDYEGAFRYLSTRVRSRALVVLFSQVIDMTVAQTLVRRMKALKGQHLPLVVLFKDSDVEALLEPTAGVKGDWYVKAAAAEMLRWQKSIAWEMKRAGALVLETDASALTGRLITRYLQIKARNLL
jgi:uncharacterized protein (DUF58 family)